jgi:hypothetical protein
MKSHQQPTSPHPRNSSSLEDFVFLNVPSYRLLDRFWRFGGTCLIDFLIGLLIICHFNLFVNFSITDQFLTYVTKMPFVSCVHAMIFWVSFQAWNIRYAFARVFARSVVSGYRQEDFPTPGILLGLVATSKHWRHLNCGHLVMTF